MAESEIPQDVRELQRQYAREVGTGRLTPGQAIALAVMADRAAHAPDPSRDGVVEAPTRHIYLAARYSRAPELRAIRDELTALGYTVTSRWIDGGHELTKEGSTQADEAERTRFATEDLNDLRAADTVISFTEEPRKTTTRGGRHVEFGVALERGQRLIVIGHRENVFHCLPEAEFYETWATALSAIEAAK